MSEANPRGYVTGLSDGISKELGEEFVMGKVGSRFHRQHCRLPLPQPSHRCAPFFQPPHVGLSVAACRMKLGVCLPSRSAGLLLSCHRRPGRHPGALAAPTCREHAPCVRWAAPAGTGWLEGHDQGLCGGPWPSVPLWHWAAAWPDEWWSFSFFNWFN
jgi:hypothetical protein